MIKKILWIFLGLVVLVGVIYALFALSTREQLKEQTIAPITSDPSMLVAKETIPAGADVYYMTPGTQVLNRTGRKVGRTHYGTVDISEGTLYVAHERIIGGEITMDMHSIDVQDLRDANAGMLENHLKSAFYNVQEFPAADFVIHTITPQADGRYIVVGNLTIKGITQQITFPADITVTQDSASISAGFWIDRFAWDINALPSIVDKYLGINFQLTADK